MLVISRDPQPVPLENVVVNATVWLSWLAGGLVALSYARTLSDECVDAALQRLVSLRGYPGSIVTSAGTRAAIRRIVLAVGVPVLLLVSLALALSPSGTLVMARAVFGVKLLGYVLLLAIVLAGLARWGARLSAARAGTAFLALALVPHLAHEVWRATPSVPALFEFILQQVS